MSTAATKKFFTIDSANQTLPLVRAVVQDIVELFRDVNERRERLEGVRSLHGKRRKESNVYSEELEQMEQDLEKDFERLEAFVSELEAIGVEFKDPMIGLVDFPTRIDGREAYLCWKLGEDQVRFWHELDGGFKGRRALHAPGRTGDGTGGNAEHN